MILSIAMLREERHQPSYRSGLDLLMMYKTAYATPEGITNQLVERLPSCIYTAPGQCKTCLQETLSIRDTCLQRLHYGDGMGHQ